MCYRARGSSILPVTGREASEKNPLWKYKV